MKDPDRRLAALGRVEIDRDLSHVERDVWAAIDARAALRPMPSRWAAALCGGVAVLALLAGAGAAAASVSATRSEPFAIQAPLAPSSILG